MPYVERSSSVKEQYVQRALMAGVPGLILIGVGVVLFLYQQSQGGALVPLSVVLMLIGVICLVYMATQLAAMKKVPSFPLVCPFCKHRNEFMEPALSDVRCDGCQRQIPIIEGRILQVWQVRCGFCNHLNYYSEKSTGLLCEECNREVPISTADGSAPKAKAAFDAYARHDDDRPYDLVLEDAGAKGEDLVACLQHMLALNRNQVKDMLEETPITLLTGIPKKKAELLKAQIEMHHGRADARVTSN